METPSLPHHLYGPLNVDLAVESEPLDLVDDHVDDDEGARAPDPRGAVHHEWAHRGQQQRVRLVALKCKNKHELFKETGGGQMIYRVIHQVSDLSWVDCDFSCSTASLILLGLMRVRQNGQLGRAR